MFVPLESNSILTNGVFTRTNQNKHSLHFIRATTDCRLKYELSRTMYDTISSTAKGLQLRYAYTMMYPVQVTFNVVI